MRGMRVYSEKRKRDAVAPDTVAQGPVLAAGAFRRKAEEDARGIHGTYLIKRLASYSIFMATCGKMYAINPRGDGAHLEINRQILKSWLRIDYITGAGDFSGMRFGKEALTLRGHKLSKTLDLAIDASLRFSKAVGEGKVPHRPPEFLELD